MIKEIGIPVGRPQTIAVDLSGQWLSASRQVRISTSMRIYWDQIQVASRDRGLTLTGGVVTTRLDPIAADLRWRGFSAEATKEEPFTYDYARVSTTSPWKVMPGRYTREGDVRELLRATDDMFVVSRPGDEIALSFDAAALPPLPAGWTRTFLLYSDGYSKEMDLNSASPDQAWAAAVPHDDDVSVRRARALPAHRRASRLRRALQHARRDVHRPHRSTVSRAPQSRHEP